MTILEAIEEYLANKKGAITHDTYVFYSHFLDLFGAWCKGQHLTELSSITTIHVQQFVAASPTNNSRTKHARAQVIKSFLSWCSLDDEMGVQVRTVKRIEMPKIQQSEISIFSSTELLRLFRACEKLKYPHRNSAIVHMLLDTGIRASELCFDGNRPEEMTGLLMQNLFLSRQDSYIRVMGKGRKPRTVGIGQETTLVMRKYINRERPRSDNPFVFLAQGEAPLSVRALQQFLKKLGEVANVDNVHPHRFRHTFAVNQLLAGTSDLVLMQLLGHTSLEATKLYVRAMSELQIREASKSVVDWMHFQKPTR